MKRYVHNETVLSGNCPFLIQLANVELVHKRVSHLTRYSLFSSLIFDRKMILRVLLRPAKSSFAIEQICTLKFSA